MTSTAIRIYDNGFRYFFFQISPTEIEVVVQEIPDVIAVAVAGIPDPIALDLPAALVIRKTESLTAQFIDAYVRERVSDHKFLRGGIYFVNKLPLTYSGKVMRREVKKIATEMYQETKSEKA
jgi:4-coumarate--CoA ligase